MMILLRFWVTPTLWDDGGPLAFPVNGNCWFSWCSISVLISNPRSPGSNIDGSCFDGLLDTFLEEVHNSSVPLRLPSPNVGTSLLQNHHLWGYCVRLERRM